MKNKISQPKWENIEGRFNVAGVAYADYKLVFVRLKPGTIVYLVGEPSNKFDSFAIRIETNEGIKLGYVPARSIQQSELWNAHNRGFKCIAVITAFDKSNPDWCKITVQAKRTTKEKLFNTPFNKALAKKRLSAIVHPMMPDHDEFYNVT